MALEFKDYYRILGLPARRGHGGHPEGLPQACAPVSPGRQSRRGRGGEVQGDRRSPRSARAIPRSASATTRSAAAGKMARRSPRPRGGDRRTSSSAGAAGRLARRSTIRAAGSAISSRRSSAASRSGVRRRRGRGAGPPAARLDDETEITVSLEDAYFGARKSIAIQAAAVSDAGRVEPACIATASASRRASRTERASASRDREAGAGKAEHPATCICGVRIAPHPKFTLQGQPGARRPPRPVGGRGARRAHHDPDRGRQGDAARARPARRAGSGSGCAARGFRGGGPAAGDLFAVVRIVVPAALSRREKELFEQLAAASTFKPR